MYWIIQQPLQKQWIRSTFLLLNKTIRDLLTIIVLLVKVILLYKLHLDTVSDCYKNMQMNQPERKLYLQRKLVDVTPTLPASTLLIIRMAFVKYGTKLSASKCISLQKYIDSLSSQQLLKQIYFYSFRRFLSSNG